MQGQISVDITTDSLKYNAVSQINVTLGSEQVFRVRWRNSSSDVTTLPTDAGSILVQNLNGVITCPDGECQRFTMTAENALEFNPVNIGDDKQKFWCQASAGDGDGLDSIVPKVCSKYTQLI